MRNCLENQKILANAILYLQKHTNGSTNQTVCADNRLDSVTPKSSPLGNEYL